jgi:hypothetical protein
MKIILIILGIALIAFVGIQLFALKSQQTIETYPYTVLQKHATFEIRSYQETLFTSVKLPNIAYKNATGKGFSMLATYIFGGNEKNQKIAMTAPVAIQLQDSMTMMFMVPQKLKKDSLPKPNQSNIKIKKEPAKTVAAIRFGGWANEKKIATYKQKLQEALHTEGIAFTNRFYFFGYNAPYEVFNRKNEIIVELQTASREK